QIDNRITNDGYDSNKADVIYRIPPYPSKTLSSKSTRENFLKLICKDDNTPLKKKEIEKQVNDMLNSDMIEPSCTPYLSIINLVKEKNNEWRFVVDFRAINKIIQPQSHHIPRIDSILDKASGKLFYTSLDLKNSFHQLTLDKNSRYLTGFPTYIGIFQYKRIPMGLVGSPDFFNHIMEKLFSDSNNFVYLDDVLLTNDDIDSHIFNVQFSLSKAYNLGLKFSLSKCLFFQHSLKYLGFIICHDGVKPNPAKTKALTKKAILKNEKELRLFLGTANYYRKHIPSYSKIASILYDTINNFLWTDKHTAAFEKLKKAISAACTLSPPDPTKQYTIMIDASIQGIGAALMQDDRPIAFASRTLKRSEAMYAPVQLEALGLVYALKQFSPYIYGKRSVVLTDQNSLLSLMTKKDVSNILDRYKNYIMGFDLDIKYIKGADNTIVDYLSRQIFNINLTSTYDKFDDIFPKVSSYLQYPFKIDNFVNYLTDKEKDSYLDGKITIRGKTRIYVPQKIRFMVLTLWYEHPLLGRHTAFDKGAPKFKDIFHWPAIDNDIKRIWSSCNTCLTNTNKHTGPLQASVHDKRIPIPPHPWHTLSIDHLTISENNYILVVIDEFSKFVSLYHTTNMGTNTTISHLQKLFFLLGFPHTLKSDNSPTFIADNFKHFCHTYNNNHYLVSPYNYQGNAIVKRFNRTIRESLCIYNDRDINDIIFFTQYAHNFSYTTNQEGRHDLLQFIKSKITLSESDNDKTSSTLIPLPKDTVVYKKLVSAHKNDAHYSGPYKIIEHIHGDTYLISKITQSNRATGPTEKCNARLFKLAPRALQPSTLPFDIIQAYTDNAQDDNTTMDIKLTLNIAIPTLDSPTLNLQSLPNPRLPRKRGRPKKNSVQPKNISNTKIVSFENNANRKSRGRPRKDKLD
uniref:Integrase catalytic domain-containing protein n=1 Tax=Strongyloides stercoralis TaxID=6248 RepID=A0AAF5DM36_STRER